MSYILDALRKADAERERDPSRGIHAQPVAVAPVAAAWPVPRLPWLIAAALVGVAAAVLFWPPEARSPVAAAMPAAPAPLSAMPAAPAAVAPVPADAVLPPQPAREAVAPRAAPPQQAAPQVAAKLRVAMPAPAPAAAAAPTPSPDRVVAVNELPAEVQRELPKLAISGGVFSENAAQRMLIVGGNVVNEGAELAPGLVLEQIRAKSAVLRFRGWRYSLGY